VSPIDRLTCEQTFERLEDYLDRELSAEETAAVRAHLETCAVCAEEYAFEARVLDQVRSKLRRIEVPAPLLESVLAILRGRASDP
jgi:mycothiol system anti-sigma-R factor